MKTLYIADDGTNFDDKKECEDYGKEINDIPSELNLVNLNIKVTWETYFDKNTALMTLAIPFDPSSKMVNFFSGDSFDIDIRRKDKH